jgi:hypothetical protein
MIRYEPKLTEVAIEDLARLSLPLQQFVEHHLDVLAGAPAAVSRPTVSPPYPPGGMVYEIDCILEGEWHHFAIFFLYGQDEGTLIVTGIGHTDLDVFP